MVALAWFCNDYGRRIGIWWITSGAVVGGITLVSEGIESLIKECEKLKKQKLN